MIPNSLYCSLSSDILHKDEIKKYKCEKYTEIENSPYFSCPMDRHKIMWKVEVDTPNEDT